MGYLIGALVALLSSIVLFFTMKEFPKTRIVLIIVIWVCLGVFWGVHWYIKEPRLYIVGDNVMQLEVNEPYIEMGAKGFYYFTDRSNEILVEGNVDSSKPGTYTIDYILKIEEEIKVATRTVHVVDDIPPVITLLGEKKMKIGTLSFYHEDGFTAMDNYDGDITQNVTVKDRQIEPDLYERTYYIVDQAGNQSSTTRTIEVKDEVPPTITLNGMVVETVSQGNSYYDSGAVAMDDVDGDISSKIEIIGSVDTEKIRFLFSDLSSIR